MPGVQVRPSPSQVTVQPKASGPVGDDGEARTDMLRHAGVGVAGSPSIRIRESDTVAGVLKMELTSVWKFKDHLDEHVFQMDRQKRDRSYVRKACLICLIGVGLSLVVRQVRNQSDEFPLFSVVVLCNMGAWAAVTWVVPWCTARVSWGDNLSDAVNVVFAAVTCALATSVVFSALDAPQYDGVRDTWSPLVLSGAVVPGLLPVMFGLSLLANMGVLLCWTVFCIVAATSLWPRVVPNGGGVAVATLFLVGLCLCVFLAGRQEFAVRSSWLAQRHLSQNNVRHKTEQITSSTRHMLQGGKPLTPSQALALETPLSLVIDKLTLLLNSVRNKFEREAVQSCLDTLYKNPDVLTVDMRRALRAATSGGKLDESTIDWMSKEVQARVVPSHSRSRSNLTLARRRRSNTHNAASPKATPKAGSDLGRTREAAFAGLRPNAGAGEDEVVRRVPSEATITLDTHVTQVADDESELSSTFAGKRQLSSSRRLDSPADGATGFVDKSSDSTLQGTATLLASEGSEGSDKRGMRFSSFRSMVSVNETGSGPRSVFGPHHVESEGGGWYASLMAAPTGPLQAMLPHVLDWDFDIFEFAEHTNGRPLATMSLELFITRYGLIEAHSIDINTLCLFLSRVEDAYCFDPSKRNPYHNNIHAADVVQATGHFLNVPRIADVLDELEALSLLLAAAVHDFRHPGLTSNFLIATHDALSVRYNDISVLENFHVAEAFALLGRPRYNFLSHLAAKELQSLRYSVIQCVLATDLSQGQRYFGAFKPRARSEDFGADDGDALLLMQIMLKCADVAHPSRPTRLHVQWSRLIATEFYLQGDIERERGLPISPLCDRRKHNLAKSQRGFVDFVVKPSFQPLSQFAKVQTWIDNIEENTAYWKAHDTEYADAGTVEVGAAERDSKRAPARTRSASGHGPPPAVAHGKSSPLSATVDVKAEPKTGSSGKIVP